MEQPEAGLPDGDIFTPKIPIFIFLLHLNWKNLNILCPFGKFYKIWHIL
jgi:hypothetical protein